MRYSNLLGILKHMHLWVIISLFFTLSFSCNKISEEPGCGCGGLPQITIEEEQAKMNFDSLDLEWYIQRDSGMLLYPCDEPYPDSLKIDGLKIIWKGDIMGICQNVKSSFQWAKFTEIRKL